MHFPGKKSVIMVRFLALGLYSNFEGSWHAKKYKSVHGCPPTVGTGTGNVVCTEMLYYRFRNGVWICLLAHGPINGGGLISGYRPVGLYARNYGTLNHLLVKEVLDSYLASAVCVEAAF